jgi:hypothetical protein
MNFYDENCSKTNFGDLGVTSVAMATDIQLFSG